MSQTQEIPPALIEYVEHKTTNGKSGGRPHFILELAKSHPAVTNEILNLLEEHWIKSRSLRSLARKYKTSYFTLRRLVQDLEPMKESIVLYLQQTPQRKCFYNPAMESSDYETVTMYIQRQKREDRKHWKEIIAHAEKCWKFLNRKNPENWSADDVVSYLRTLKDGSQFNAIVAVRQVAPQIANKKSIHYISTIKYKAKIKKRKKDIFAHELKLILKALDHFGLKLEKTIFLLHITTGAREGTKDTRSGLCGLRWDNFKKDFSKVDIFESKVRSGITWKDCPVKLFFDDLPQQLRDLWKEREKPTTKKVIEGGYVELLRLYHRIKKAVRDYWKGKLEPSLYADLTDLKPHDADKIHVNILWEAGTPLEVVSGQDLGHGEGLGLVGRGWLDTNVIKQHYLSLTARSKRFQEVRNQITGYSRQFNESGGIQ